jgi:tRNA nucleotidyltransferase/poly(A) polymerase
MTPEQRLAQIAEVLDEAGVDALVLGGHAVRYYGIDRNTIDLDFVTETQASEVRARLAHSPRLPNKRWAMEVDGRDKQSKADSLRAE